MFDDMYSQMINRFSYKKLMVLPIALAIFMALLIAVNGIPQGLDFAGGSWIEITLREEIKPQTLKSIESELTGMGAENLEIYLGAQLGSDNHKITISTTTVLDEEDTRILLEKNLGELRSIDVARIKLETEPKPDIQEKISSRIAGSDISFIDNESVLVVKALDIDAEELKRALEFYLDEGASVELKSKNYRMESIGKTLGDKFWEQGMYAVLFSYLLIIAVIFFVFRDMWVLTEKRCP